jgi:hypothetical protein
MAVLRGLLALLCVVSSAESRSFSEVAFYLKEAPALFIFIFIRIFIRNDKGQVAKMLHVQDGRVTSAKKIK